MPPTTQGPIVVQIQDQNAYVIDHVYVKCIQSSLSNHDYITNFPTHGLIMEIMQKSFFHEFVFFAHECCAFKTCMMPI
jgi:hypothetical protein